MRSNKLEYLSFYIWYTMTSLLGVLLTQIFLEINTTNNDKGIPISAVLLIQCYHYESAFQSINAFTGSTQRVETM